jgi:hypothetical protein
LIFLSIFLYLPLYLSERAKLNWSAGIFARRRSLEERHAGKDARAPISFDLCRPAYPHASAPVRGSKNKINFAGLLIAGSYFVMAKFSCLHFADTPS